MMGAVLTRLAETGIDLPVAPHALGAYIPAVRSGNLVFTSGQLPTRDGQLVAAGTVGESVSPEDARLCAQQCAANALGALASACDLDSIVRVVKLVCYVASASGFTGQPDVADAASAVMLTAFGEAGRHVREAVGVAALPLGAPVELSLVVEVLDRADR